MLDVFFLSYDEPFADENFELLTSMWAPHAKRVHGIKGIFDAHKECARLSKTKNFYVVDADCVLDEQFNFSWTPSDNKDAYPGKPESGCVYVWRSRNPINDLLYGYGGVKCFPKKALMDAKNWNIDMTTTLNVPFVPKFQISNVTMFNTDPFNTWKSAFRECTKLASAIIPNGDNTDNEYRLKIWQTRGLKREYGKYAIDGAAQGADFGKHYRKNPKILAYINDFDWLKDQFKETYE